MVLVHCSILTLRAGLVVTWGNNTYNQNDVPAGLADAALVAGGGSHCLALRSNGTVVAWGWNLHGQANVPSGLTGVRTVAAGGGHSLALRGNGTVTGWGYNFYGQTVIPNGLNGVVGIACGGDHSLAVKSNGTVVAWGKNGFGQTNVPAGLTGAKAVAGGKNHTLVLKNDGTVVAWGANFYDQTNLPAGLSDVMAIAAGGYHSLALKRDGSVVAWGYNADGQTNVPPGLANVVAISAGAFHSLALKSDGTVVAWGRNDYGQSGTPVWLNTLGTAACGDGFNIGISAMNSPPTVDIGIGVKASTNALAANTTVTFSLMATNAGSTPVGNVFVTNMLPVGANFLSAAAGQGSFVQSSGVTTFELGTLPPASMVNLIVQASFGSGGRFTNYAQITSSVTDATPSNNTATAVVTVNTPPVFNPIPEQFIRVDDSLVLTATATDADVPADVLIFELLSGPPGASITTDGVFTWTPSLAQAPSTNTLVLRVTDNGVPSLSATQSFQVVVTSPHPLVIESIERIRGYVSFEFNSSAGYVYQVQSRRSSDGEWFTLTNLASPAIASNVPVTDAINGQRQRFYRVRNLTIPYQPPRLAGSEVSNSVFCFHFLGDVGRSYAVEWSPDLILGAWQLLTNITVPTITSSMSYLDSAEVVGDGREYRVNRLSLPIPAQRFDQIARIGTNLSLTFTVDPGLTYFVEFLEHSREWTILTNLSTMLVQTAIKISDDVSSSSKRFYRLRIPIPSTPVNIGSETVIPDSMNLGFKTEAGRIYTVQHKDSFHGQWQDLQTVGPFETNGFQIISDWNVHQAQRLYRLKSP